MRSTPVPAVRKWLTQTIMPDSQGGRTAIALLGDQAFA